MNSTLDFQGTHRKLTSSVKELLQTGASQHCLATYYTFTSLNKLIASKHHTCSQATSPYRCLGVNMAQFNSRFHFTFTWCKYGLKLQNIISMFKRHRFITSQCEHGLNRVRLNSRGVRRTRRLGSVDVTGFTYHTHSWARLSHTVNLMCTINTIQ